MLPTQRDSANDSFLGFSTAYPTGTRKRTIWFPLRFGWCVSWGRTSAGPCPPREGQVDSECVGVLSDVPVRVYLSSPRANWPLFLSIFPCQREYFQKNYFQPINIISIKNLLPIVHFVFVVVFYLLLSFHSLRSWVFFKAMKGGGSYNDLPGGRARSGALLGWLYNRLVKEWDIEEDMVNLLMGKQIALINNYNFICKHNLWWIRNITYNEVFQITYVWSSKQLFWNESL